MIAVTAISVAILAIMLLFGLAMLGWLASELQLVGWQIVLFNVVLFFLAFMVLSFVFGVFGELYGWDRYFWEWQFDMEGKR